jgi:hypothetical protein
MQLPASYHAVLFWGGVPPRALPLGVATRPARFVAALVGLKWMLGTDLPSAGFFGGRARWPEMRPWRGALWRSHNR